MLFITKMFHIETARILDASGLSAAKAGSRMDSLEAERDNKVSSVTEIVLEEKVGSRDQHQ